MLKTISLVILSLLVSFLNGCGGSSPAPEYNTTFASIDNMPTTHSEVQAWLNNMPTQASQISSKIVTATSLSWDEHIIPFFDFNQQLSDNKLYNNHLMTRSHDPNIRALGSTGYQQIPQIQDNLYADTALKSKVLSNLASMNPSNPKQEEAKRYFESLYSSKYSTTQLQNISKANQALTTISLIYYNNAATKSASTTFSAADFACLTSTVKNNIPTDPNANYIFDATSPYYYTLLRSCLSENVREKIQATRESKAAAQNAQLWPIIASRRLVWANAFGSDNFALERLSDNMLTTTTEVHNLLNQVDSITAPAFDKLKTRYKTTQASYEGSTPTTIYQWNQLRYIRAVITELQGSVPSDPKLLKYPEAFDNMLYLFGRTLGLKFVKTGAPKTRWNSNIVEYKAYNDNSFEPIGTFLLDPFAIPGVTTPANAGYVRAAKLLESGKKEGHIVLLNGTLTKSESENIYMSLDNYKAFAHELGHVMQMLLRPIGGTLVAMEDFIEIPSMTFECMAQHPDFLKSVLSTDPESPLAELPNEFKTHWKYYKESPLFICENQRYQLANSATSLNLSTWVTGAPADLGDTYKNALAKYQYPYSKHSQPGYNLTYFVNPVVDATYYHYVLANVVALDILSVFNSSSDTVFDKNYGKLYRQHILEQSAYNRENAIKGFLGRDWNYNAYKNWFEEMTKDL